MDLNSLDHRIDFARIQMLEEAGLDSPSGLLKNLLQIFYSTTLQRLDEMEARARQGILSEVARIAHNLRASCGTFGATAMSEIAREIETRARAGNHGLVPEAIQALRALFPRAQEQLQAHLTSPRATSSSLADDTKSFRG